MAFNLAVVEFRDARIPYSSASHRVQPQLSSSKRLVVALKQEWLGQP